MKKQLLHLLHVLGSLYDTNHAYTIMAQSVTGIILPIAILPGMSLFFSILLKVSL